MGFQRFFSWIAAIAGLIPFLLLFFPYVSILTQDLADAVLHNCGASTARFASLTTFLAKTASSSSTPARGSAPLTPFAGHGTRNGLDGVDGDGVDNDGVSRFVCGKGVEMASCWEGD